MLRPYNSDLLYYVTFVLFVVKFFLRRHQFWIDRIL